MGVEIGEGETVRGREMKEGTTTMDRDRLAARQRG